MLGLVCSCVTYMSVFDCHLLKLNSCSLSVQSWFEGSSIGHLGFGTFILKGCFGCLVFMYLMFV